MVVARRGHEYEVFNHSSGQIDEPLKKNRRNVKTNEFSLKREGPGHIT